MIRVEVVYAEADCAVVKACILPDGARVGEAIAQARADPLFSRVDLTAAAVGVFGRLAPNDRELRDGDRVEIYRPLAQDPKVARRARARQR